MGAEPADSPARAQSAPTGRQAERRAKLRAGLLKQFQKQYGQDPVRTSLLSGELATAPELRSGALTPAGLQSLEARVAKIMSNVGNGVGNDVRPLLPAVRLERKPQPSSADYNADLTSMASWTEVNKYRQDFFDHELRVEAQQRQSKLDKLKGELKHQQLEMANKRENKRALVKKAAAEEADRWATYMVDKGAEEARRQAKVQHEMNTRAQQSEERRARRAVEQRLKELEDGETLRKIREAQEADRKAFEQKVKDDERKNIAFMEDLDNQRRMRQQKQDEETALQLKLNAEWKAILDKQEADRNRQYTELKERIAKQQRVYESNAGAEDAARMAAEEAARKRWMEKFERETREKEEARVAHRKRMQNECLRMQNEQIAAHRAEKDAARQEAIRLKGVMKEQARQEKEERLQEARDDRARALKYGARLKEQIADIVNGRANDPGSHVMTPLEASLNRPLLISMRDRKYEGFNATLG